MEEGTVIPKWAWDGCFGGAVLLGNMHAKQGFVVVLLPSPVNRYS